MSAPTHANSGSNASGRTAGARKHLSATRDHAVPQIHVQSHLPFTMAEHFIPSATRNVPTGLSINWHGPSSQQWNLAPGSPCQPGVAEVTLAATGRKAGMLKMPTGSPDVRRHCSLSGEVDASLLNFFYLCSLPSLRLHQGCCDAYSMPR